MVHKWFLDDGEWLISCEEKEKWFAPSCKSFKKKGECPHCGEDAKVELDKRRREKLERERQKEMKEELRLKNTLEGYF